MRNRALVGAVLAVLAITGCGANEHDQVKAKVQEFLHAVDARDYRTICQQVLAPVLLNHLVQAGIGCERALQIGLQNVVSPTLTVGPISIDGNRAAAITISTAKGQKAALAALQLVKTGKGWRITSLGAPVVHK
jgi:hypothetical protein